MATIALVPIVLNDVLLKVAADNYEAHVSQVQFDPATTKVAFKGMTPAAVFNFGTTATWTCTLTFAQDWATANSLSKYLFENEGKAIVVEFKPKKPTTTGPTWTATVVIEPGTIGGQVDTVPTATVTLAVNGKPALTVA